LLAKKLKNGKLIIIYTRILNKMVQIQDTTQVEVKINNYDMYESNTTPHEIKGIINSTITFNKLKIKYDVEEKYNYLCVKIFTEIKNEKAWRQFKLIWTTRENYEKIVSDSVKMLKEHNYLIVPILNYKSVFSSYMDNKDQIEGWNRVFRIIFHSIIDIGGVLSKNKNRAFTIIMNCNLETVNLLKSNQLTLEQIMITRHILGKLIDPGNLWLGSHGMQLVLIQNDTTYSLVARKPGNQGKLNPDSSLKYIELLKPRTEVLKSVEDEQDDKQLQEQLEEVSAKLLELSQKEDTI
jgi:hypothetical protein